MLVWVQGLSGEGVAGSRHARTINHVVEGRHVLQNRALRPQVSPRVIPSERGLFRGEMKVVSYTPTVRQFP